MTNVQKATFWGKHEKRTIFKRTCKNAINRLRVASYEAFRCIVDMKCAE